MSGLACPSCQTAVDVFPPVSPERSIWAMGVERLAQIPIHPFVAGERGRPLVVEHPESPQAAALRMLAHRVRSWGGSAVADRDAPSDPAEEGPTG